MSFATNVLLQGMNSDMAVSKQDKSREVSIRFSSLGKSLAPEQEKAQLSG